MNFSCQHCHRVCDWSTREPVESDDWKTVASFYCNAEECIQAEEAAHGLPRDRLPWRSKTVQVRVTKAMREQWAAEAAKDGVSLSEWIRRQCDEVYWALYEEVEKAGLRYLDEAKP